LNPIWQKAVAQRKWFNPKHMVITLIVSALLVVVAEFACPSDSYIHALSGAVFVPFSMVIGRHVCNLLVYAHMDRKPDEIAGQLSMSHGMVLSVSLYSYITVLLPLALVAIFVRTPFAIGGLCGAAMLMIVNYGWIRKNRSKKGTVPNISEGQGT